MLKPLRANLGYLQQILFGVQIFLNFKVIINCHGNVVLFQSGKTLEGDLSPTSLSEKGNLPKLS